MLSASSQRLVAVVPIGLERQVESCVGDQSTASGYLDWLAPWPGASYQWLANVLAQSGALSTQGSMDKWTV